MKTKTTKDSTKTEAVDWDAALAGIIGDEEPGPGWFGIQELSKRLQTTEAATRVWALRQLKLGLFEVRKFRIAGKNGWRKGRPHYRPVIGATGERL